MLISMSVLLLLLLEQIYNALEYISAVIGEAS